MKDFPVLIGISKIDAIKIIALHKIPYRIHKEDRHIYLLSKDIVKNRVNLIIKDNIVVEYEFY